MGTQFSLGPLSEERLAQSMFALDCANEIRTKRAKLKKDIKAGKANTADLLLEPPDYIMSMKLFELLMATPKFGQVKINHILHMIRISPSKTIGGLSPRQRAEIVRRMRRV